MLISTQQLRMYITNENNTKPKRKRVSQCIFFHLSLVTITYCYAASYNLLNKHYYNPNNDRTIQYCNNPGKTVNFLSRQETQVLNLHPCSLLLTFCASLMLPSTDYSIRIQRIYLKSIKIYNTNTYNHYRDKELNLHNLSK